MTTTATRNAKIEELETLIANLQADLDDCPNRLWESEGNQFRLGLLVEYTAQVKALKEIEAQDAKCEESGSMLDLVILEEREDAYEATDWTEEDAYGQPYPADTTTEFPTEETMSDPIEIALAEVEYTVECEPEEIEVEGNCMASGDDDFDAEVETDIREQLNSGNEWAWCTIRVSATLGNLTGTAFLGACSYASKADFIACNDYYADMKAEALADLDRQVRAMLADVPTAMLESEIERRILDPE